MRRSTGPQDSGWVRPMREGRLTGSLRGFRGRPRMAVAALRLAKGGFQKGRFAQCQTPPRSTHRASCREGVGTVTSTVTRWL
jgi:hypothetical protein